MSHYNYYSEPHYESFVLSLNIDDSRISSKELRSYLLQLEKLVYSVNQTLQYCHYDKGYDEISIDVLAFEQGSFILPLSIKKLSKSKHFENFKNLTKNPTAAIILGDIIVNLLMGSLYYRNHYDNVNNQYGIEYKEFLYNTNTAKAVKEISKLTIENDSIQDISVTYEKANGEKEMIRISKSQLRETKDFMEYVIDENEISRSIETKVSIISPDFSEEKSMWKLLYNESIIEAEMLDKNFLHNINERRIAFRKNDMICVTLVIIGRGNHKEYYIKNVIDF